MKLSLKEIAKVLVGRYQRPEVDGEVCYLQVKDFDEGGRFNGKVDNKIKKEEIPGHFYLQVNDVLYAAKGDKNFAVIYPEGIGGAVASPSFLIIRLIVNFVLPEFLVWYLNHPEVAEKLKKLAIGTNIRSISRKSLAEFRVEVPPLEKQVQLLELAGLFEKARRIEDDLSERKRCYRNGLLMSLIK